MSLLALVPTPVLAGGAVVAAVAIFGGGFKVSDWRAAGALGAEKLSHQADVAKLQNDWTENLEAMRKLAEQAQADLEAERLQNQIAKENAEHAYQADLAKRQAAADRATADAQRVRDDLTAAIAAGRSNGGTGSVQQAGPGASCSGSGGRAICGLFDRAVDLARRCAQAIGEQHAGVVEAVAEWPRPSASAPGQHESTKRK